MPRPIKCRRVCHFPETLEFSPDNTEITDSVVITIDEFEAIRLIDKEGLSQQECGRQLGVARTTAQKIYDNARKKLAEALVGGQKLTIQGGDYKLCNGSTGSCYKKDCFKKQIQKKYNIKKGDNIMRIAVTYEDENIFQHFGHTKQFKIYDVENGSVKKSEIISTIGSEHGALAGMLEAMQTDVLICGGIGGGAQTALRESGIRLYGGVSGNADNAIKAFIAGDLDFDPKVHCEHHNHEHNGQVHSCSGHGCGNSSC